MSDRQREHAIARRQAFREAWALLAHVHPDALGVRHAKATLMEWAIREDEPDADHAIAPPWTVPVDLDPGCLAICNALNKLPGVRTTSSCSGHREHGFWIFFRADSWESLTVIAYCADACHSGACGWRVIAWTDCSMQLVTFLLEGPAEDIAGANKIAEAIERLLKE